jgi:hypothetical protein
VALDDPADAWTVGSAVLAFVLVFAVAGVAAVVILGLSGSAGDGELRPGAAQLATLSQDAAMLVVPFLIASALAVGRARGHDFGLRAISPRRLVASVLVTFGGFFALSFAYAQFVDAEGSQDTLFTLGAERGGLLLVGAAVLVIVCAPVVSKTRKKSPRLPRGSWLTRLSPVSSISRSMKAPSSTTTTSPLSTTKSSSPDAGC